MVGGLDPTVHIFYKTSKIVYNISNIGEMYGCIMRYCTVFIVINSRINKPTRQASVSLQMKPDHVGFFNLPKTMSAGP